MKNVFDISSFVDVLTINGAEKQLVDNVKARRKQMGYTQSKLAKKTGVSCASIRRFEQTGEISLTSLLKIAQALNCLNDFTKLFEPLPVKNLKDL